MEIYSTEEQQVDAIKQFWKDYGTSILVGAVVGLGGLYGWNYFSAQKVENAESASVAFQQIRNQNPDAATLAGQIANFDKAHDQKGYQALLDLMLAKQAVEAGDLTKAADALTQVIAAKPGSGLGEIATLRLARIQAQEGQIGTALSTLDTVTDAAFAAQRDELKGDFLVRQGETDKARTAYLAAKDALAAEGQMESPALQMKIDNLNKA
ncbi:tetratricopeptide repeat protein [Shewanella corallii]|uniref:Ancillary SecYEG translocon subunit n=2 Tax=Shewanella TaxID=22 RepID=A0ABT0NAG4_9GAMM|nr:tetratricopeptide repeat protein [Shewanella submarina]MCL2915444.1 tetratricopeptide repeat protein [Shewanella corallii]